MFPLRYGTVKIFCQFLTKFQRSSFHHVSRPGIQYHNSGTDLPPPILWREFGSTGFTKVTASLCSPCFQRRNSSAMSTRAASGLDSPESGMGPGPGPGPRRVLYDNENSSKSSPQPSDESPSKCLEQGYGKPLKPARRSFFNFCKRVIRIKEKPSNCPECPTPVPEESFWDYLFKFDTKTLPEPSTCRIAQRNREACRKTDPRLSDPRYHRTEGDVLVFTEPLKQPCCRTAEPQPKPPPAFALPRAVACRLLVEEASSPYPAVFVKAENKSDVKARCSSPRPRRFRLPYEECRPARRTREPFSCKKGVRGPDVAPPMSIDRGTCGGKSVGEILAEATIPRTKSTLLEGGKVASKSQPSVDVADSSRIKRLQLLTRAKSCGEGLSKDPIKLSQRNKHSRKISTDSNS